MSARPAVQGRTGRPLLVHCPKSGEYGLGAQPALLGLLILEGQRQPRAEFYRIAGQPQGSQGVRDPFVIAAAPRWCAMEPGTSPSSPAAAHIEASADTQPLHASGREL